MAVPVEICVEGIASALAAGEGGASRVEVCEDRGEGGVTPGAGTIAVAVEKLAIPVHVLIRPRRGDFVYSDDELLVMKHDVRVARAMGAAGVVFGFLDRAGRVDRERTAWLVEAAGALSVTFHKAFDLAPDPSEALEDLIGVGVGRVLTSGGGATALAGRETLRQLTRQAGGRIAVMAGGSIRLEEVESLLGAGVREIHLGSAACDGGRTDAGAVRRIVEVANRRRIYHIARRDDWERACREGTYRPRSMDVEGFIHASTGSQLTGSANRFYRGATGLVVLAIDLGRLAAPVDWAISPDSADPFPHIHGAIDRASVVEVVDLEAGASGEFRWPPAGA